MSENKHQAAYKRHMFHLIQSMGPLAALALNLRVGRENFVGMAAAAYDWMHGISRVKDLEKFLAEGEGDEAGQEVLRQDPQSQE